MRRVLVTGGAGFIGSHLARFLMGRGDRVRVLDSLDPQVHGATGAMPGVVADELEAGDVRDPAAVTRALRGVDAVVHLAAVVGVGQSMYQIRHYVDVNEGGTAVLLEALLQHPVERLVVASSMSVYGEGLARTAGGERIAPEPRRIERLREGRYEVTGPDGLPLEPVPTPETKEPSLASVYALGKYSQERLSLLFGQAYGVPTTALRFFNVYGPGQALSNPYTGVLAIFAARLLNGRPPMIFEDGRQRRDFVHVRDVARACMAALDRPDAAGGVFNVGSGEGRTIVSVARALAAAIGSRIAPEVTGRFRTGDIRHCFADLTLARSRLGYAPVEAFEDGVAELAEWLSHQDAVDRVDQATAELRERGLVA
jgi:dTDP-L-rhamnose 4-epimerase